MRLRIPYLPLLLLAGGLSLSSCKTIACGCPMSTKEQPHDENVPLNVENAAALAPSCCLDEKDGKPNDFSPPAGESRKVKR